MIRYPALARIRVGCVKYLNSKPLIHGCDAPVIFDHPSGLARDLVAGRLDVALVPVFEALRTPSYPAVDGVAIACDGPVYSVFLAHRGPLEEIRTITLDPASLTSVHLLQVLLREFHGLKPTCLPPGSGETDAELIIGNQAIDFRLQDGGQHRIFDLGEEWRRCTGLPFVFAVWLMRPGLPDQPQIAEELRRLKTEGLTHLPEIVQAEEHPELAAKYLTEYIRFDLGPQEKAAIARYRELLERHGFIAAGGQPLAFL